MFIVFFSPNKRGWERVALCEKLAAQRTRPSRLRATCLGMGIREGSPGVCSFVLMEQDS